MTFAFITDTMRREMERAYKKLDTTMKDDKTRVGSGWQLDDPTPPKDVKEIVSECFDFPHEDESNWITIEVAGVNVRQYPSPLEVKMMIEDAVVKALTTHTDKRVREEWQKAIELADKIESQYTNTEFNEWRAFKGFRNALDDKLQALSD